MKPAINTVLMAAAFALPPRVVERQWHTGEREKMYSSAQKIESWKIEFLDTDPSVSGLMRLDRGRDELSWVSANGADVYRFNLRTRTKYQRASKLDDRGLASYSKIADTKFDVNRGTWELLKKVLYFVPRGGSGEPLWNLSIADDLVGIEVDKDRSTWMGLSTYPNTLYHLFWIPGGRRDEALFEILKWDEDSELVAWVPCAEGRSLLLENRAGKVVLHGLRENSKLRTLDWENYAELDLPHATNMLARTCSEVYVSGVGGVARISAK